MEMPTESTLIQSFKIQAAALIQEGLNTEIRIQELLFRVKVDLSLIRWEGEYTPGRLYGFSTALNIQTKTTPLGTPLWRASANSINLEM